MQLAGIPVRPAMVEELIDLLDEPTRGLLRSAYADDRKVVALTIDDRHAILRALDDPPDELCELRGVLLEECVWRLREGLV